jgi:hypothetical protein
MTQPGFAAQLRGMGQFFKRRCSEGTEKGCSLENTHTLHAHTQSSTERRGKQSCSSSGRAASLTQTIYREQPHLYAHRWIKHLRREALLARREKLTFLFTQTQRGSARRGEYFGTPLNNLWISLASNHLKLTQINKWVLVGLAHNAVNLGWKHASPQKQFTLTLCVASQCLALRFSHSKELIYSNRDIKGCKLSFPAIKEGLPCVLLARCLGIRLC